MKQLQFQLECDARNASKQTKQDETEQGDNAHREIQHSCSIFIIEYIDFLEILCLTYLYFFVATGMNVLCYGKGEEVLDSGERPLTFELSGHLNTPPSHSTFTDLAFVLQ